jgi:methyl-accepting chemotaxis protein
MTDTKTEDATMSQESGRSMALDLKVLAAVASLVVLLVIAIAIAVALIVTLGHNASVAERQGRYTAAVNAAALHAKGLANDERGYFISGDTEFVGQMGGRIDLARAAFASAAEAASPAQRATLAEAREGFERWLDALEDEIALYQSGDEATAIEASLGPTRDLRKAYEGWLADAASLGVDAFQDATAAVSQTSSLSVIILVGYLVVAVILGVAIALWVVRTVLRPTYALVRMLSDAEEDTRPTPA